MRYPKMIRVKQKFDAPTLKDVEHAVRNEVEKLSLSKKIREDESIAITVGSRGIANMALIIKTLVEKLKALGGKPFIVPAMGSHGGGTAERSEGHCRGVWCGPRSTREPRLKVPWRVVQIGNTEDGVTGLF